MPRSVAVVVMAGGKGERMRSSVPKSLHEIGGLPMLGHILNTAYELNPKSVSVVMPAADERLAQYVREQFPNAITRPQAKPLGTANAVLTAREDIAAAGENAVILYGDAPLIQSTTLQHMLELRDTYHAAAVFLGFETARPAGYGRIQVNADNQITAIVEERDATEAERSGTLCNGGILCADAERLLWACDRVDNNNAASEFYLTDIVSILRTDGSMCIPYVGPAEDATGVNSRAQLAAATEIFQTRARRRCMDGGVTLLNPSTVYFAHDTEIGADSTVGPHVTFGPNVRVGSGVDILSFCDLHGCSIEERARIGPHARIRPGTTIGPRARIGNYVEIKASTIGADARINHLAYVGDATVGDRVNIGAGTITCNYDGEAKHRTTIGNDTFIGSNSSLVAPVTIGNRVLVGAGSVITTDVEDDALVVGRVKQVAYPGRAGIAGPDSE